jgi:hypothetical protein
MQVENDLVKVIRPSWPFGVGKRNNDITPKWKCAFAVAYINMIPLRQVETKRYEGDVGQ